MTDIIDKITNTFREYYKHPITQLPSITEFDKNQYTIKEPQSGAGPTIEMNMHLDYELGWQPICLAGSGLVSARQTVNTYNNGIGNELPKHLRFKFITNEDWKNSGNRDQRRLREAMANREERIVPVGIYHEANIDDFHQFTKYGNTVLYGDEIDLIGPCLMKENQVYKDFHGLTLFNSTNVRIRGISATCEGSVLEDWGTHFPYFYELKPNEGYIGIDKLLENWTTVSPDLIISIKKCIKNTDVTKWAKSLPMREGLILITLNLDNEPQTQTAKFMARLTTKGTNEIFWATVNQKGIQYYNSDGYAMERSPDKTRTVEEFIDYFVCKHHGASLGIVADKTVERAIRVRGIRSKRRLTHHLVDFGSQPYAASIKQKMRGTGYGYKVTCQMFGTEKSKKQLEDSYNTLLAWRKAITDSQLKDEKGFINQQKLLEEDLVYKRSNVKLFMPRKYNGYTEVYTPVTNKINSKSGLPITGRMTVTFSKREGNHEIWINTRTNKTYKIKTGILKRDIYTSTETTPMNRAAINWFKKQVAGKALEKTYSGAQLKWKTLYNRPNIKRKNYSEFKHEIMSNLHVHNPKRAYLRNIVCQHPKHKNVLICIYFTRIPEEGENYSVHLPEGNFKYYGPSHKEELETRVKREKK